MNILTFDIEEWYIEKMYHGGRKERYLEFDRLLDNILDILDENNTKATFFCLGEMAKDFPYVIKQIYDRGHEIGSHSNKHFWLTKLNRDEVCEDTKSSIDSLEQLIGEKVLSYRAPAFSIGENNKWAFEVLAECGIERDASIFPAQRDFGGFSSFGRSEPAIISYKGIELKEFPISTTKLFGKEIVYSGGGYFRLFPLTYIKNKIRKSNYTMTYFHIGDLLSDQHKFKSKKEYEIYFKEPGTLINRSKRYIKSNLGMKGAYNKLEKLIQTTEFINLEEADKTIDWKKNIIKL
ncbi:MAG: polysaccharide deacetylase family protein [Bacteroidales bacterium]|nr:polysaccharide deacetylase family protein [Bacteroidales bacterium]